MNPIKYPLKITIGFVPIERFGYDKRIDDIDDVQLIKNDLKEIKKDIIDLIQRKSCSYCLSYGHVLDLQNINSCPSIPYNFMEKVDMLSLKYGIEHDCVLQLALGRFGRWKNLVDPKNDLWNWQLFENILASSKSKL